MALTSAQHAITQMVDMAKRMGFRVMPATSGMENAFVVEPAQGQTISRSVKFKGKPAGVFPDLGKNEEFGLEKLPVMLATPHGPMGPVSIDLAVKFIENKKYALLEDAEVAIAAGDNRLSLVPRMDEKTEEEFRALCYGLWLSKGKAGPEPTKPKSMTATPPAAPVETKPLESTEDTIARARASLATKK